MTNCLGPILSAHKRGRDRAGWVRASSMVPRFSFEPFTGKHPAAPPHRPLDAFGFRTAIAHVGTLLSAFLTRPRAIAGFAFEEDRVAHSITQHTRRGARTAGKPRRATTRPRILIAEDDVGVREFVDRVLREAGYDTVRVIDGQEGVEVAKEFGPFQLLLTDLMMPRMTGTELARRLRQSAPNLKVLYLTAYSDQLFAEKRALWDDEAVLEKPSSVDAIVEAVSLLLNGHLPRSGG